MNDQTILTPLVERILELSALPQQEFRKKLWADHQALIKTQKIPVSVYWEGIPKPQWVSILGNSLQQCVSETGRQIEYFLRRVIWFTENIPDDHIVWPMVKLMVPMQKTSGWGLNLERAGTHNPLDAAALAASMQGPIDISKLTYPEWVVDESAWQQKEEEAKTLTGGKLDLYHYYDHLDFSPFDIAADMRGMEQIMMDAIDDPEGLHSLMNFITTGVEKQHLLREKNGWLNQQVIDRTGKYQPVLEHRIHCAHLSHTGQDKQTSPSLATEWPYVSAQTSSGFGPDMYAEFVQPYNCRLAAHFTRKTVYYHGCETLDQKIEHIQNLPNLRRQHVSPWSSVSRAVEVLQGKVIMEVHSNPSKVFFGWRKEEIQANLRELVKAGQGMSMDLNLSDIHSFNNKPEILTLWAEMAQRVAG